MKLWRHLDARGRCLAIALCLLAVSLLEPRAQLPGRVHDWYFVVDITQSMNVRDAVTSGNGISRLAFAKQQMRQALRPAGEMHRDPPCHHHDTPDEQFADALVRPG